MSTTPFDTFKFVDRLEKTGLSREQAAAIAEAQKDSLSEALAPPWQPRLMLLSGNED